MHCPPPPPPPHPTTPGNLFPSSPRVSHVRTYEHDSTSATTAWLPLLLPLRPKWWTPSSSPPPLLPPLPFFSNYDDMRPFPCRSFLIFIILCRHIHLCRPCLLTTVIIFTLSLTVAHPSKIFLIVFLSLSTINPNPKLVTRRSFVEVLVLPALRLLEDIIVPVAAK